MLSDQPMLTQILTPMHLQLSFSQVPEVKPCKAVCGKAQTQVHEVPLLQTEISSEP